MIQSEVYQVRVSSFMSLGSADPDLIQISNLFRWWRLCVVTMTSLHGANHNCAIVVIRMAQLCHHCATSWWRCCRYEAVMATRDVNSWEITFPDWDAIPGSWSRLDFCPRKYLLLARSESDRWWGAIAGRPWHCARPMPWPHRRLWMTDRHSRRWRARNVTKLPGGYEGSATGEEQWPIGPRRRARESPCPL